VKLCVFLSSNSLRKMVFVVNVDEHANLLLKGSQKVSFSDPNYTDAVYTWVSTAQETPAYPLDCKENSDIDSRKSLASCPQVYSSTSHVAQLLNLVINMHEGEISSFAWDTGCAGCGPSRCMQSAKKLDVLRGGGFSADTSAFFDRGACGQEVTRCSPDDFSCDLKLFITWAGTDRSGNHLRSAGTRLSKFTGHSLGSLYETMDDSYTSTTKR